MATNVPIESNALSSDRGWSFVFYTGEASFSNRGRVRLSILIQESSQALVNKYQNIKDTTTRYIYQATTRTETQTESLNLESRPVIQQRGTATTGEPDTTRGNTSHYQANPFTPEPDHPEDTGRMAPVRETASIETPPAGTKRTWMWVASLIVIILFLIMVPGLILGLVTRQVAWGLAISGAIAPAVVFFGGLYYHHNK